MNLAKKGTALLAALSVFAITSCGGSKENTLTFAQAMEWLKDVKESDGDAKTIKSQVYDWNLKVTGTGMEPDEEKGLTGGAQFLVAYLVTEDEYEPSKTRLPELLAKDEFQPLKSSFDDDNKKGKKASEDEMAFVTQDKFEDILFTFNAACYGHKMFIKNDMLHLSFNRVEEVQFTDDPFYLEFKQELAIKKDGFVEDYTITTTKMAIELKHNIKGTDIKLDMNGTVSGAITAHFAYQE